MRLSLYLRVILSAQTREPMPKLRVHICARIGQWLSTRIGAHCIRGLFAGLFVGKIYRGDQFASNYFVVAVR